MTMTISEALLYSLLGISVVFFALLMLIVLIWVMTRFTYREKKAAPAVAEAAPVAAAPAAPAAEPVYAPGTAGELKLYDTDERDAAMIMAIVADELGVPLNELRFRSIKEVK